MKGVIIMKNTTKLEEMKKRLPVDDPKYIAFIKLNGILGEINPKTMREEKIEEIITRYKHCT
ncbi:MAG: hypothetical protein K6E18_03995 [Lachnospiraceae bacterium]|nr:hypothetical protein [Lachnospiraceae bacterium]